MPPLTATNHSRIIIGDSFSAMRGCFLYANEGELVIGAHVLLNSNVQLGAAQGRIEIGNHMIICPNLVLRAADHGIAAGIAPRWQRHVGCTILIDDDVWIGANVVVTRNVRLGAGCVVAAAAVVTKDVEPDCIVAGVPARVVGIRT